MHHTTTGTILTPGATGPGPLEGPRRGGAAGRRVAPRRFAARFGRILGLGALLASALPMAAGCRAKDPGSLQLAGTTWRWQRSAMNDDTVVAPDDPSHYTLTFRDDGTLSARVDCNQMGGTYEQTPPSITIELTHGTRAMCPPDSLDVEFQRQIAEARQMVSSGDALHLVGQRGTMTFVRATPR